MTIIIDSELAAQLEERARREGRTPDDVAAQLLASALAEAAVQPPPDAPPLRPFGLRAGEFRVPDDFDAPLPEDEVALFEAR